jgi:hypothetical protein
MTREYTHKTISLVDKKKKKKEWDGGGGGGKKNIFAHIDKWER